MTDRATTALALLRDLIMDVRECFEARDARRLVALLEGVRHGNVNGRFLDGPALIAHAEPFASGIEAPRMFLVRVESLAIEADHALATYLVDASWVDRGAWREVHTSALVTFEARRRGAAWRLEGVTVAELPPDARTGGPSMAERAELVAMSGHGVVEGAFYSFMGYPRAFFPS